jgi:hypothetical protein
MDADRQDNPCMEDYSMTTSERAELMVDELILLTTGQQKRRRLA